MNFVDTKFYRAMRDMNPEAFKNVTTSEQALDVFTGPRPTEETYLTKDIQAVIDELEKQKKGMPGDIKQNMISEGQIKSQRDARAAGASSGMRGRSLEGRASRAQFESALAQSQVLQDVDEKEQEIKDAAEKQLFELTTPLQMQLKRDQDDYDRYRNELMFRFGDIMQITKDSPPDKAKPRSGVYS